MMANKILEIEKNDFIIYHGNYETYKVEKEQRKMRQQDEYVRYQKEKAKRETRMAEMRQRASTYINPALGRLIKSKEKFIEREIYANEVEKVQNERKLHLHAPWGTHREKLIIDMQHQDIWYDKTILIKDLNMEVRGKDRIKIAWSNGSGKTTLLKYIVAAFTDTINQKYIRIWNDITFDYFDQHNEILQSHEILYSRFSKNIKIKTDENSIRSQLAMIGMSQHEIYSRIDSLSYGQKVKIKFLQMLSAPIDVLILDEPTNHLDIPTRERIEDMLQNYQWTLIFVSHDQYFAEKIKYNIIYRIQDKKLFQENLLI